jgi:hypothetical protein
MDSTEIGTGWRKSTRSNGSGQCVEVGHVSEGVAVRDTQDRGGAVLRFTPEAWREFASKMKS